MLSDSYDSLMLKFMSTGEQGFFITEVLNLLIDLINSCQTGCWYYNSFLDRKADKWPAQPYFSELHDMGR